MKKVTMKAQHLPSFSINEEKFLTREQLNSLLKTYNSYYSDQENLQLSHNQPEGGRPFVEGLLSISWGVRHPIRLKIQDEKQLPSFVTLKAAEGRRHFPAKRGMTRWGEFDDLHHISGDTVKAAEQEPALGTSHPCYQSLTLQPQSRQEQDCATLPRARSEAAALRRRTRAPTIARREEETHRFSINGHFYNYETSVFTPAFGSETKIRINSQMRTRQVIEQLLRKFKGRRGDACGRVPAALSWQAPATARRSSGAALAQPEACCQTRGHRTLQKATGSARDRRG
ncbi:ras association domain-containing protein 6 isoform X2 [Melanerpes formicivorus]|uniref:ras association domain-containing protein 6 isoform X2 n=1 Tax=Melanerpes formicivorus TaxID=211600 RepID=UPI00358E171E